MTKTFRVHDRVEIAKSATYYKYNTLSNPTCGGIVYKINGFSDHPVYVRWDNGWTNAYTHTDLQYCNGAPPPTPYQELEPAYAIADTEPDGSEDCVKVPNFPLIYCAVSGDIFWTEDIGKVKSGDKAGNTSKHLGYVQIRYKGVLYYAHRLAFLTMLGEWPKEHVDHTNGVRSDNSWVNLREATHRQNLSYRGKPKNNTSGKKGVSWQKRDKSWRAMFAGKCIGYFKDFDQACSAYSNYSKNVLGDFYYEE